MINSSLFFLILLTTAVCNHKKFSQTWSWLREAPRQRNKKKRKSNIYVERQERGNLCFWWGWAQEVVFRVYLRPFPFLLMTFVNRIPTLNWEQLSQGKGGCRVQQIKPYSKLHQRKCLHRCSWPSFIGEPCLEPFSLQTNRCVWGLHKMILGFQLASFKHSASTGLVSEGQKHQTSLFNRLQYPSI